MLFGLFALALIIVVLAVGATPSPARPPAIDWDDHEDDEDWV
jgi:hypothetical protein